MISDNDIKKLKIVFATKDDLKQYATKDDVKIIVDQAIDQQNESIDNKLTIFKNDIINKVDNALDHQNQIIDDKLTGFRSDIMDKLDLVISELRDKRDEQDVITHQLSDHEDRIVTLEAKSTLVN